MAAEMTEPQDGLFSRREFIKRGATAAVLATLDSFPAFAQGPEGQEAAIMTFTPEQVKSKLLEWIKANPQGTASLSRPWAGPQHMYDIPRREAFVRHAKEFMFGSVQNFDIGTTQYENPNNPTLSLSTVGPRAVEAIVKKGDAALAAQAQTTWQKLQGTYTKLYSVHKPNGHVLGAKRDFDRSVIAFLAEQGEGLPSEGRIGQGGSPPPEHRIIESALAVAKLNDDMTSACAEFIAVAENALK